MGVSVLVLVGVQVGNLVGVDVIVLNGLISLVAVGKIIVSIGVLVGRSILS